MFLDPFILFMFIIPLTTAVGTFDGSTTNNNIAKPNCPTACGNITVPYPFDGCTSYIDIGTYKAFTFSTKNKYTVVGCDDVALISGRDDAYFAGGCNGLCREEVDVADGECSGIGCCQTSMPKGLTYYNVKLNTLNEHSDVLSFNACGYGFLVEEGKFKFNTSYCNILIYV
ncbi:hypothetical protein E3N88_01113 [Mikania micrantha]|uniref:Wall-associated receptor kinase galacturonan-binding domain-containing protein n=1 Tax=Mikania micrantha TaxID=192012 RepID=A0A5N6Q1I7_9ASTR|nr:hypothetical protein E3N88_01113 [Mikania micrantha]